MAGLPPLLSLAPIIYAAIGLALLGVAAYMAGRVESVSHPQVFVPALGGLWFSARAAIMIWTRKK